jgi:hypothetical protein
MQMDGNASVVRVTAHAAEHSMSPVNVMRRAVEEVSGIE